MKRVIAAFSLFSALLIASHAAHAGAPEWTIDAAHARAQFAVRHLMVSTTRGELGKVTGTATWDGKTPAGATVTASIDVTGVTTGDEKRDAHLRSPDFFDTAKYPTITFKSKRVEKSGSGLKVTGDLTIRGISKEVTLDIDGPTAEVKDPWGNQRIGATATTKLSRKDFGLKYNAALETGGVAIGDEVSVTIDLELIKKAAK